MTKRIEEFHGDKSLDIEAVPRTYYRCPVCNELCNSEEEAKDHYKEELAFQEKFKNAKVGDFFTDKGWLQRITSISWCYDGYKCGKLLTIFDRKAGAYYLAHNNDDLKLL